MGLIIPGSNDNLSKMAKEAGAPPPQMSPQQIPLDRIIVEISAQVAKQMFDEMMKPVLERIAKLEEKTSINPDEFVKAFKEKFVTEGETNV